MLSKPPPQPFDPARRRRRRARQRLMLVAGLLLVCVAAWLACGEVSAPPMVLARRGGQGSVATREGWPRPWAPAALLDRGDVLELDRDGEAIIEMGDHLRVFLAPSTRLVLGESGRSRWGGQYRSDLAMVHGRAWLSVRGNVVVTLSSPVGRVRLGQGSAVEVLCDAGAMRVMAWRGEATCLSHATRTAEYMLAEGQALVSNGLQGEQRIESLRRADLDPLEMAWLAQSQ